MTACGCAQRFFAGQVAGRKTLPPFDCSQDCLLMRAAASRTCFQRRDTTRCHPELRSRVLVPPMSSKIEGVCQENERKCSSSPMTSFWLG